MLKHETETMQTASIPAAERRVSAEELTRAVSALEDAEAAERIAGVAPIGQVVDELGLDSTPEEIWEQVQKQRAEAEPKTRAVPMLQNAKIGRQVRRGWRQSRGWLWVLFWCTGGFGLLAGLPHLLRHQPPGIVVSGDGVKGDYRVKGTGSKRDVTVTGDGDKIMVHGGVRILTVDGDDAVVTVDGSVQGVRVHGDNSKVHWTKDNEAGFPVEPYEVSGDNAEASQSRP